MFRLTEDYGVINRCGFNSSGAHVVEEHLKGYRSTEQPPKPKPHHVVKQGNPDEDMTHKVLHWIQYTAGEWIGRAVQTVLASLVHGKDHTSCGIVGLNIGMNKDTADEVQVGRLSVWLYTVLQGSVYFANLH